MNSISKSAFTEAFVFAQRGNCRKGLAAVLTFNLLTTVGVHSLVATEIGELGVGFETDFTLEWFDTAVDVLMLLQAARCRKGLSAFSTGVAPGSYVLGSYMALKVAWIGEDLVAILTAEFFE